MLLFTLTKKERKGTVTLSLILLGAITILVAFNVGESIFLKLKIKKSILLIFLGLSIVFYFIPSIKIGNITFTWIGFFLPFIFSLLCFFKVKKGKHLFKMFVCVLITFSASVIYNLITFDVYESAIFQPYIVLAIIIGSVNLFLAKKPTNLYASNFIGLILADVVFYYSRYSIYGEYYLTIGSNKVFEILLISFLTSLLTYYFVRKIKVILLRRKLKKKEANEAI